MILRALLRAVGPVGQMTVPPRSDVAEAVAVEAGRRRFASDAAAMAAATTWASANTPALGSNVALSSLIEATSPIANTPGKRTSSVSRSDRISRVRGWTGT